jgi:hypothetical protein
MKFLHKTFEAKRKEIIEVDIDQPTKVKFMTGREMKAYKMGKTHTYFGGLFEESPVRFVVPFDSLWNVVVEKGTHSNPLEVHAKCGLLPPNGLVRTSIAADAPPEMRLNESDLQDGGGLDRIAAELSSAARSEG